jgi:hypothetical protein
MIAMIIHPLRGFLLECPVLGLQAQKYTAVSGFLVLAVRAKLKKSLLRFKIHLGIS